MVDKRRSRKKRRTEVSSSEDSSDSSDSEVERTQTQTDKTPVLHDDAPQLSVVPTIDSLQVQQPATGSTTTTTADVVKTRLAIHKIAAMDTINSSGNSNNNTTAGVSSDEWLVQMLGQYGDDIETLRRTAPDFRGESIALLADLLRNTSNVFHSDK